MASVIQSVKNSQTLLGSRLRSGTIAGVKNTQASLRKGLGLTARLPVPSALGAVPKARRGLNSLQFADDPAVDEITGLI